MALKDINRNSLLMAMEEFKEIGVYAMLEKYAGGRKRCQSKWVYIDYDGCHYDLKVTVRAAHEVQGLGPLPPGEGTFTAPQAKLKLEKLGFQIVRDKTGQSMVG